MLDRKQRCPTYPAERKTRFIEREKQMELARKRGEAHIGADAVKTLKQNG
ncbi:MAG TPA: hypothetical protein VIE65_09585 [Methylobacter sp.]|jgi:UPF0176 protein